MEPSKAATKAVKTKILVIEDTKMTREHIGQVLLSNGLAHEVVEASNGLEGFKVLMRERPHLVLCDITMPQIDGYRFLEMRATREDLAGVPVLMLTAAEDVANKVRALNLGAVDYITKPFEEAELCARVKAHLQLKMLQDELRDMNALLEKLSITDELTGTFSRRHLLETLDKEFARSQRYDAAFSFLMLDVDHFKNVNDCYGHLMGDFVLQELTKLISAQLRSTDILARYGGEEFAAILPGTDAGGASTLAERIRSVVENHSFRKGDAFVKITVSAGVISCPNPKFNVVDDIIRGADTALYRAKDLGRNTVQMLRRSS